MTIQDIVSFVVDYGFGSVFIAVFMYAIIQIILITKQLVFNKYLSKFNKVLNLRSHSIFAKLDYCIYTSIPQLIVDHPVKEAVLKDVLIIKFKTWREDLFNCVIANENTLEAMNSDQLYNLMLSEFSKSMNRYDIHLKQMEVPKILVDNFNQWHDRRVKYVRSGMETIIRSEMYYSNIEKVGAVFDIYSSAFNETIVDAENAFNSVEIDYNSINYKPKYFDDHSKK